MLVDIYKQYSKKLVLSFIFYTIIIFVSSGLFADTCIFDDGDPANHLWSNPDNWAVGSVPTYNDTVIIRCDVANGKYCLINTGINAAAMHVFVGDSFGNGRMVIDGGSLEVTNAFRVGVGDYSNPLVEIRSGSLTCASVILSHNSSCTGAKIKLIGGTLETSVLVFNSDGLLVFEEGAVMTFPVDYKNAVWKYIIEDNIMSSHANYIFNVDYNNIIENKTTVSVTETDGIMPSDSGLWAICRHLYDGSYWYAWFGDIFQLDHVIGARMRVDWAALEPTDDNYDWSIIDIPLKIAERTNKYVSIAVRVCSVSPQWVLDSSETFDWTHAIVREQTSPVPWDVNYVANLKDMVRALAARYDGNPRVSYVCINGPSSLWGIETNFPLIDISPYDESKLDFTLQKFETGWKDMIDLFVEEFDNTVLSLGAHNEFQKIANCSLSETQVVAESIRGYAINAQKTRQTNVGRFMVELYGLNDQSVNYWPGEFTGIENVIDYQRLAWDVRNDTYIGYEIANIKSAENPPWSASQMDQVLDNGLSYEARNINIYAQDLWDKANSMPMSVYQPGIEDADYLLRQPYVRVVGDWVSGLTHPVEEADNRLLLFFAYAKDNDNDLSLSSVTYGGEPLTRVCDRQVTQCDERCYVAAFYLKDYEISKAVGSDFSVDWNGNTPDQGGYSSVFLENVFQGLPVEQTVSNTAVTGTEVSTDPVDTYVGDMVILAGSCAEYGDYQCKNNFVEAAEPAPTTPGAHVDGIVGYKMANNWDYDYLTPKIYHPDPKRQAIIAFKVNIIPKGPLSSGLIDNEELISFAIHWLDTGCSSLQPCSQADWFVDGEIDINDFAVIAGCWLRSEAAAVFP